MAGPKSRLVILDRDGVINHDSDAFIKTPDEWVPIPGSIEAIASLSKAGFNIAVASNQSGVGRGLFDVAALEMMHAKLRLLVETAGGQIDHIVYCPHTPEDGCACRKPRPGLFELIGEHFDYSLEGVPAIGDSLRDLEAAAAAGASPVLVRTGNGNDTERRLGSDFAGIPVYDSLADAALALVAEAR